MKPTKTEKKLINAQYQIECCICHNYQNMLNQAKWYTPELEERRKNYLHDVKISHGYCPSCHILVLRKEGIKESEIEEIVKETE